MIAVILLLAIVLFDYAALVAAKRADEPLCPPDDKAHSGLLEE